MASIYKMEVVAESSEAQHIYEDVEVENRNKIDLKPDKEECNEAADLKVKNGKKKCSWKCFFAVFVMALLLGTVGTCIFLVYKVVQLQSEIADTMLAQELSLSSEQQGNVSLSAVHQQLTENAASLERQVQLLYELLAQNDSALHNKLMENAASLERQVQLLAQNDTALYNKIQQLTENVASLERQVQLLAQNNSVLHNNSVQLRPGPLVILTIYMHVLGLIFSQKRLWRTSTGH